MSKYHKKVLRKQGECILAMKNLSASGASDPWPTSACFTCMT